MLAAKNKQLATSVIAVRRFALGMAARMNLIGTIPR
jgi:hypothetical protein